jgi:hypothetical protein
MTEPIDPRDRAILPRLRALRHDQAPARDLWPDIAARIASTPVGRGSATIGPFQRVAPWALAASIVIAVLLGWQHRAARPDNASLPLVASEARAMTRQYDAALRVINAGASVDSARIDSAHAPALQVLDRSSAEIRRALERDPDARFLLERLQHTYARRLALTERAALG